MVMSVIARRRAHARERALERFNTRLTRDDFKSLVDQITSGKSIPVPSANRSLAIRCHVVEHPEMGKTAVLYDKNRKVIVTVLPPDSFEMNAYHAANIPPEPR